MPQPLARRVVRLLDREPGRRPHVEEAPVFVERPPVASKKVDGRKTPEFRAKMRASMKRRLAADPSLAKRAARAASVAMKAKWADPAFRDAMSRKINTWKREGRAQTIRRKIEELTAELKAIEATL